MIITRLNGGLGNQMFQYACGRAMALRNNDTLKLDISTYAKATQTNTGQDQNVTDTPRRYGLFHFNIHADIALDVEAKRLRYPFGPLSQAIEFFNKKVLRDFNVGFVPQILKKKGNRYLDGFWQSENNFGDYTGVIKKDFNLKSPLSPAAQEIANEIRKPGQAVSIHVRRGDIAANASTNPYYGICTPEYYSKSLNGIAQSVQDFRVFVFSDDIEWAKKNIPISHPTTYVSDTASGKPAIPDYEELVLMSMCDHNIIANSSFSWWAAWLNGNLNKIVIAPKEWIKHHKNWHTDTVPPTWIRL
jgi:hypothetical protein